jgi:hypothetical protein
MEIHHHHKHQHSILKILTIVNKYNFNNKIKIMMIMIMVVVNIILPKKDKEISWIFLLKFYFYVLKSITKVFLNYYKYDKSKC